MATVNETGILLVCLGNICRSPTAHGVLRQRAAAAGLLDHLRIDSAGTHGFHTGARPDRRALAAAAERDYDLTDLRARQVTGDDLQLFDYVLAMDRQNLETLEAMAQRQSSAHARIALFMDFAPDEAGAEVPDPYYGGANGFEAVLDLVERGADGLLHHLQAHMRGRTSAGM